jgi:hypothetical protein
LSLPKDFANLLPAYKPSTPVAQDDDGLVEVTVFGRKTGADRVELSNGLYDPKTGDHNASTVVGFSGCGVTSTEGRRIYAIHVGTDSDVINKSVPFDETFISHLN